MCAGLIEGFRGESGFYLNLQPTVPVRDGICWLIKRGERRRGGNPSRVF